MNVIGISSSGINPDMRIKFFAMSNSFDLLAHLQHENVPTL